MQIEILVVDDSPTDRLRIIRALQKSFPSAKATEAKDGDEAIIKLRSRPFDVLLTDQHMGSVSGINVLREAKKVRPETLRVMMTADEDVTLVQEALKQGVQGYILKRWTTERIADEMRRLFLRPN